MRSSVIVAFTTLGLIASASAQQIDQNTRAQIERLVVAYTENTSKRDAAGIAALFAKDGMQVTATGVTSGRQEIEGYQSFMKTFSVLNIMITIEQISPLGNDADIRIGQFHLSGEDRTALPRSTGAILRSICAKGGYGKSVF